jgi:ligand-binding sensor domain-containing protein
MKRYLLFLLLLSSLQFSKAQNGHLKFDHFSVTEGLPERQVRFIKQDQQGYIWMGTQNGLVRYDGYKPKVYRMGVTDISITQNCTVNSMIADDDNNLWFATRGNGLFKYNYSSDSFIQYKYPTMQGSNKVMNPFFK